MRPLCGLCQSWMTRYVDGSQHLLCVSVCLLQPGLKCLENRDRDRSCTKICHCWLTQSGQETGGLKTAHEKYAMRLSFKPCLQAFGLKNNTHRWPFMFSSLGAFFPAGMRGLDDLLRLCGDSSSAPRSDHVLLP